MDMITILLITISCTVELSAANFCYESCLEKRRFFERKDKLYVLIFSLGILLSFCEFVDIQKSQMVLSPVLFLLIQQAVYRGSYQTKIISYLFSLLVIKGVEFLFIVLMNSLPLLEGTGNVIFWTYILSVKMFSWVILILLKERFQRMHNEFANKKWLYMAVSMACITAMFVLTYIGLRESGETGVNGKVLIAFLIMFVGNIAIFEFYSLQSKRLLKNMEDKFVESETQLNKKYYDKISDIDEKRMQLVHDLKHYMTAIQAMIKTGEKREAINLLEKLERELSKNELRKYTEVSFLDAVLSEKYEYAIENNVKLDIYVEPGVSFGKINKTDYIVMLSNLADNAVEAAKFCQSKEASINIFTENEGHFLVTKIQNTFDTDKLKNRKGQLLTTKKLSQAHGIGLKSVRAMTEDWKGSFVTDIKEDQFTAILILPT